MVWRKQLGTISEVSYTLNKEARKTQPHTERKTNYQKLQLSLLDLCTLMSQNLSLSRRMRPQRNNL